MAIAVRGVRQDIIYDGYCLHCGRSIGRIENCKFYSVNSINDLVIKGGSATCGHCTGNVFFNARAEYLSYRTVDGNEEKIDIETLI